MSFRCSLTAWHVLYVLWLAAGAMDFWLHRASSIESTSGIPESRLHLAQIAILGLATVLWLGFRAQRKLGDPVAAAVYARRVQTEFPNSEQAQNMRNGVNR